MDTYEFAKVNVKKGIYRHFKGKYYRVIGFGRDCNDPENGLVYYQALYGNKDYWVRPVKEFLNFVNKGDYTGYRFVKVHVSEMGMWAWFKHTVYLFFEPLMFWRSRI